MCGEYLAQCSMPGPFITVIITTMFMNVSVKRKREREKRRGRREKEEKKRGGGGGRSEEEKGGRVTGRGMEGIGKRSKGETGEG